MIKRSRGSGSPTAKSRGIMAIDGSLVSHKRQEQNYDKTV